MQWTDLHKSDSALSLLIDKDEANFRKKKPGENLWFSVKNIEYNHSNVLTKDSQNKQSKLCHHRFLTVHDSYMVPS